MFNEKKEDFVKEWKKKLKKAQSRIIKEEDAEVFDQLRDLRVLQALAVSEFEDALVIVKEDERNPVNFCNLENGFIHLNFTKTDSEKFKKMVALHEAGHLNITPLTDDLSGADQRFVVDNKTLINILEDMRVNRYICLKYPGLPRYFDSELEETNNPFTAMTIGDLLNKEIQNPSKLPDALKPFYMFQDEIREAIEFKDVIEVAKKILDLIDNPPQPQERYGECQEGDSGDDEDKCGSGDCSGNENKEDDTGGSDDEEDSKDDLTEDKMPSKKELNDFLNEKAEDDYSRSTRIFNPSDDQIQSKDTSIYGSGEIKIIKKDKEMFLGKKDRFSTISLSKHLIKLLQREYTGWLSTREGRLDKINLSKLYTNAKVFKRRKSEKQPPKAYIVLDGSGSMGERDRSWQKGLTMSLIKLFKSIGIEHRIFIHSGGSLEFYYSEIDEKDIPETSSYCYTLDGSMLKALFENEIPQNEKALVFYFSDGGIAAQYRDVQVPLLEKYNMLAEKRNTPIFGIGIETADVDVFRHWWVLKNQNDFSMILEKIGGLLTKYLK